VKRRRPFLENGMLFIHGSGRLAMPEYQDGSAFSFNGDCISVRAKHEQEGRCQVTLGSLAEVGIRGPANLTHPIRTADRNVIITLVAGDPVMTLPVSSESTRLSIWLNDPKEADEIVIGVDPG
jgi:hypothetical protein